jgi:hypothetical protein
MSTRNLKIEATGNADTTFFGTIQPTRDANDA